MSKIKLNVIEVIVKNNICIGCGVCVSVCPIDALRMEFNRYGEYNPVGGLYCLEKCNLCLRVCPFYNQDENEDSLAMSTFGNFDGMKHRLETGYYLNSYVGYSKVNNHRANGASGGMATWILETLLIKDIVDYVVCVTPNSDSKRLFKFAIFNNVESIRSSAKSVYYPVEMSGVIKEIIKNKGRYAFIGQPCFLKGLKLATKKNIKLKKNIVITVGLVCGQMKSKHYTTYLSSLVGVNGNLKNVNYRGKNPQKLVSNYFYNFTNEKGDQKKIFWNEGVHDIWNNRWFTPNACNFCDDVFAEVSDVAVMDAWLPKYSNDINGTNLLIVRSPTIRNLLIQGSKSLQIVIENIPIEKIIQSQLGTLNIKRNHLAYRLYQSKQSKFLFPTKRVVPSRKIRFLNKKEIDIKNRMQTLSREFFLKCYDNEKLDIKFFGERMNYLTREIRKWKHIYYILLFPIRVVRKIWRVLIDG